MKNFVSVVFKTGDCKRYVFAAFEPLEVDDIVVVETQYGYVVGRVDEVNVRLPIGLKENSLKEVIQKIDFTEYNRRKEVQEKMIELKEQMDKRVEQLKSDAVYEMFAEKDPELKKLLDIYKKINEEV